MERKTKQILPKRRLEMGSIMWVEGYAPVGKGKQEEIWKETTSQKEGKNDNY